MQRPVTVLNLGMGLQVHVHRRASTQTSEAVRHLLQRQNVPFTPSAHGDLDTEGGKEFTDTTLIFPWRPHVHRKQPETCHVCGWPRSHHDLFSWDWGIPHPPCPYPRCSPATFHLLSICGAQDNFPPHPFVTLLDPSCSCGSNLSTPFRSFLQKWRSASPTC